MQFPPWIVERVMARQGTLHPYPAFDPRTTAFVVIDMQNYYTQPGYQGECAPSRATFSSVNRLTAALRAAGGLVVWVQTCSDGAASFWSHHHSRMLAPGLDAQPQDPHIIKRCYSALVPGSSMLDETLKAHGISTVLIGVPSPTCAANPRPVTR